MKRTLVAANGIQVELDLRETGSLRKATVRYPGRDEPVLLRFKDGVTIVCPRSLSDEARQDALGWVVGAYVR
jgi:hypothetical protein